MRADEQLLRVHGLTLLAAIAAVPSMARPLARAGALKLVTFLCKPERALEAHTLPLWPMLLEVAEGVLAAPKAVPEVQRTQLRDALMHAARAHKAGHLLLEPAHSRCLTRLLMLLRALSLAVPTARQAAGKR